MTTKTEEAALKALITITDQTVPIEGTLGPPCVAVETSLIRHARELLDQIALERVTPAAPVATEYMLLCQPNSATRHQLEIKLYGHSLKGARATAITIGSTLYPAGYTRFGIFDGNTLVSEFTLTQPDLVVG